MQTLNWRLSRPWQSPIKCLNCIFPWLFDSKSVDTGHKCCNIAGFAFKKAELSTQTKALRVVRSVDDGSKTDLGAFENQTIKVLIFGGAQGASWEILK